MWLLASCWNSLDGSRPSVINVPEEQENPVKNQNHIIKVKMPRTHLFHAMSNYRVGNAREGRLEFLKQFHTLNVVIWSKFSHIVSDNHCNKQHFHVYFCLTSK